MYVPFDNLPAHARLWIYQADRALSAADQQTISEGLHAFTEQWNAHGHPLKSSYEIRHNRFVLLAVDEGYNNASGCSIDSSTHVLKALEQQLSVSFFDRENIPFLKADEVVTIRRQELAAQLAQGTWTAETLTFQAQVTTKGHLSGWVVPAQETWLKRYLTKLAAY